MPRRGGSNRQRGIQLRRNRNLPVQATSLLEIVEPALPPERTTQLGQLARAAVSAARDGDTSGALAKLATLVSLDPRRAEGLASAPELAPVRKDVEALLARLTATARLGAETGLREAAEVATPLSKRVDAPVRATRAAPRIRRQAPAAWLKNRWRRAPLLALLVGWLAVGLAGGSVAAVFRGEWPAAAVALFLEIWTLGFLALVGFAFYMSVKNR